jgi:exodeoxyribonuclease VII large subunit
MIERREAALQRAQTALATAWHRADQQFHLRVERQRLSPETLKSAIRLQKARLEGLGSHLEAVSPKAILSRGYVLVQDSKGRPMTSSRAEPVNGRVVLSFADGERGAKLDALTSQGDLGL